MDLDAVLKDLLLLGRCDQLSGSSGGQRVLDDLCRYANYKLSAPAALN